MVVAGGGGGSSSSTSSSTGRSGKQITQDTNLSAGGSKVLHPRPSLCSGATGSPRARQGITTQLHGEWKLRGFWHHRPGGFRVSDSVNFFLRGVSSSVLAVV